MPKKSSKTKKAENPTIKQIYPKLYGKNDG